MTMQGQEYAVFTELSPDNKAMTPGFNTRVFTDVDSQRGNSIRCDFKTGAITLAPGSYHITRRSRLLPAANLRPEGDCGPIQYAVHSQ